MSTSYRRSRYISWCLPLLVVLTVCAACARLTEEQERAGLNAQGEIANLSDYQAAILADGIVTPLEYDKAIFATVKCMEDAGLLDVIAEKQEFTGMYQVGFRVSPSGEVADEAIFFECEEEYKSEVEPAYSEVVGSDAQFALLAELMRECLRKERIEIPDDDIDGSFEDLELVALGTICQVR